MKFKGGRFFGRDYCEYAPKTDPILFRKINLLSRRLGAEVRAGSHVYGTGPLYRKLGGRVVYAIHDLQEWADRGLRNSTTSRGGNAIEPPSPVMQDKPFEE